MKECIICWIAALALMALGMIAAGLSMPAEDFGHSSPAIFIGTGVAILWGMVCAGAAYLFWPRAR